jgi:ribosomal protein S18 acetylase RimI-like enzyme
MTTIRRFETADWPAVWSMLQPTFAAGDTYAYPPSISETEARRLWIDAPAVTCVALVDGAIAGTYFVKANQPGQGAHVCNCGYVTAAAARGHGIASAMCEHSQREALALGFRAMQYNLVVATNTGAIRLWQRHGFAIVGTLPRAFHHQRLGYVDALVMYKELA